MAGILRNLKYMIFLLLCIALALSTGCGPGKPPYMVSTFSPAIAGDGSGGIFAVYCVNAQNGPESYISSAYLQEVSASGHVLWGERGIPIDLDRHIIQDPALFSDGKGNLMIIWVSTDSIWAQKTNLDGHPLWNTGKVKIGSFSKLKNFKVIDDGEGRVVVAWLGANDEFFIQKIDADGQLLWLKDSRLPEVAGFNLFRNEDGDLILIWGNSYRGCFAQKIDSQGQFSWNTNVQLRQSETSYNGYFAGSIIDDNAGGAIVSWEEYPDYSSPAKPSPASNVFHRIDKDGKIAWNIQRQPEDSSSRKTYSILSDGVGGAFLFSRSDQSLYVERIDSDGRTLWNERLLYSDLAEFISTGFNIISDNSGEAILIRESFLDHYYITRMQSIDSSGKRLWNEEGILIKSKSSYSLPLLTLLDNSGYIASWRANYTTGTIFVQKISPGGELLWGQDGISLDAWKDVNKEKKQ
jgi:hypothetical protein